MHRSAAALALCLASITVGCEDGALTPVGVTLADGQVIVGEVTTETLWLDGAMGSVAVPLVDVGVVVPVEGHTVEQSNGHVTVWLRNGSELRGQWRAPELDMAVLVGGEHVPVDLPTDAIQALQLQGSEHWPDGDLYRVRTTHGDDFLVDAEASRITVENELGTFSPWLTECRHIAPVGDPTGDWRVELNTGTVLVGPLAESELVFALPMGPEELVVPLEALSSLERGSWAEHDALAPLAPLAASPSDATYDRAAMEPEEAEDEERGLGARRTAPRPALGSGEGWFSNERLESAKRR